MKWMMLFGCTMFYRFFIVLSIETDPDCVNNCSCCKDETCHVGLYNWPNVCSKGCVDGHRGARCYELCQYENCKSCGGTTSSRVCDICYDGYYLGPNLDCTLACPSSCKSCSSNTNCIECKDGYFDKDNSSICSFYDCPTNCICSQTNCIDCKPGFHNINNLCNSKCVPTCATCITETECGKCKEGYYNGRENDNDSSFEFNNCTYECRDSCTKCVSYDECLECVPGKYGQHCQEDCSRGCTEQTCLIDTGMCNCLSNFTGDKCTYCVVGQYGPHCNMSCPNNCKGGSCDKETGFCRDGCKSEKMIGNICDACISGMYGEFCNHSCPSNCIETLCEKDNGTCLEGCKTNFNGTYCASCIRGKYGKRCNFDCPDKCRDSVCEKEFGNCSRCVENFAGVRCDYCSTGWFGTECNSKCSSNCLDGVCDTVSGKCRYGCSNNFSGDKCCTGNSNCAVCASNSECRECVPGYFNETCKDRCPKYCDRSCNFETGICDSCKVDMFGFYCELFCTDHCKVLPDVYASRCTQLDGKCRFGCTAGYFGPTCNETCSSYCIDNICIQESGKCKKGCNEVTDDAVCVLDNQKYVQKGSLSVTVIVLSSLLVLAAILFVTMGIVFIVKKRQCFQRKRKRTTLQVSLENMSATTDIGKEFDDSILETKTRNEEHYDDINITGPEPKTQMEVYEEIGKIEGNEEHEYKTLHEY